MSSLPLFQPHDEVDPAGAVAREAALLAELRGYGSAVVAYSGGVDSTYLAWAAARALRERALAVTGVSESLAAAAREEAGRLAAAIGIAHELLATGEMADPRYLANAPDRCFWCKNELYDRLLELARKRGFAAVFDGTNLDDLSEARPGRRAAADHGVLSPLVQAGLTKGDIRYLSRRAALDTWDRPASPCLSSRVPHGRRIDGDMLRTIDRAETAVRGLGFREFRVRHLGTRARLEVASEELARALEPDMTGRLEAVLRSSGFEAATVDREPFRSGRLTREATSAR